MSYPNNKMIDLEIKYNQLIEKMRFDAEHYHPEFLKLEEYLKKINSLPLEQVSEFSSLRKNPENEPYKEFLYVDISNVNILTGEINIEILRGNEAPSRARKVVKENDIIISTVRPNRNAVAIIPPYLDNQICSTGFSVIKTKKINPLFLFTYLKTKFAVGQFVRFIMASMYPAISQDEIGSILIPIPSEGFQQMIESYVRLSFEKRKEAGKKYEEANKLLSEILGIEELALEEKKTIEVSFNEIRISERFDVEYFLPKFFKIIEILKNAGFKLEKLKKICKEVIRYINPLEKPSHKFLYVEIGDIDVRTSDIISKKALGYEIPTSGRRFLKEGDFIISTVRPTRGAITIVPKELDSAVASTAFYICNAPSPLKEYLFIFLRTPIGLNQLGRPVVGAMYPTLKKNHIDEILIPLIPTGTQKSISILVKEYFSLRKESKEIFEKAKKEIEGFITKNSK